MIKGDTRSLVGIGLGFSIGFLGEYYGDAKGGY